MSPNLPLKTAPPCETVKKGTVNAACSGAKGREGRNGKGATGNGCWTSLARVVIILVEQVVSYISCVASCIIIVLYKQSMVVSTICFLCKQGFRSNYLFC